MATQDEDTIPTRAANDLHNSDSEAEETTADYPNFPSATPGVPQLDPFSIPADPEDVPQYLADMRSSCRSTGSAIPKRGLKDFEPHPTQLQASTLEASRQAMHNALLHMRVHAPKTRVVGVFDERIGETRVKRRRGNWMGTVGRDVAGGATVLRREEALWALERGSLDVRFRLGAYADDQVRHTSEPERDGVGESELKDQDKNDQSEEQSGNDDENDGLPMSLQAAYAVLIDSRMGAPGGMLSMEEYVVYAGLKRAGFIVLRAGGTDRWRSIAVEHTQQDGRWVPREDASSGKVSSLALFDWMLGYMKSRDVHREAEELRLQRGPLVKPGLYHNYQEIYRLIALDTSASTSPKSVDVAKPDQRDSVYTTTYHVYKPNASRPFRKRDPGAPDFSVCVVNARTTRLPTLPELESLLSEQPVDSLYSEVIEQRNRRTMGQTYGALKRGHRNVLLAIVDEGMVSYMKVADAVFAQEGRLFEREGFSGVTGPGGKRRGARPRGGGRG